jgi:NAD(P)-dependent dehydrogenase (short-subunit alcohol dehydrogenase family)
MGEFDGRTAIITGGTQGLGEEVAKYLAEHGASKIVITGRNQDRGDTVCNALSKMGCDTLFVSADLRSVDGSRAVVTAARSHFDQIDHLVNCAADTRRGNIVETSEQLLDDIFSVNFKAPFFIMQEVVRWMIEKNTEGSIVNVLSTSYHCGQPFLSAYSASKAALATLTKNTAFALLKNRIRVNGIAPGWMDTPGEHAIQKSAHDAPEDWLHDAEMGRAFGRLLKSDEVARTIGFLCSPASGLMTGTIVDIDQTVLGGWQNQPQPEAPVKVS